MRPRIFISIGQRSETKELDFARTVADAISDIGYEPYIALMEQTLSGLTENIFRRLEESEYFLFIDFAREQVRESDGKPQYRGSLFCQQELALAAFRRKPIISFHEDGVLREGITSFLQANSEPFSDHAKLLVRIRERILETWRLDWMDKLLISREASQFADELHPGPNQTIRRVRYYHLKVENNHFDVSAFNCCAYLESIRDNQSGDLTAVKTIEQKWRGALLPTVMVPFGGYRELDALLVYHDNPANVFVCSHTDSPRHLTQVLCPGHHDLTFVVDSENFKRVRSTFRLQVGSSLDEISFIQQPDLGLTTARSGPS